MKIYKTLKFQIAVALLLIMSLFAAALTINLRALEAQRSYNTLLNITARLEHTNRQIVEAGSHYAMNAPKDIDSYKRDVMIYYQELISLITLFDQITQSFMSQNFAPDLTGRRTPFSPKLDPAIKIAVNSVEEIWSHYKQGLQIALGEDSTAPRLDRAADYITSQHNPLTESIDALRAQTQRLASSQVERVYDHYILMLAAATTITLSILLWFVIAVLRPLKSAVNGFRKVSQGDFGYQVPTFGDNEITWITNAFNKLSSRLHAIFRLTDQIQQGSDLDDTLCFVAEQFPTLLPLDWVGALFVATDNESITLERNYRNGKRELTQHNRFSLKNTLLKKVLESGDPLHIPNLEHTARGNPEYQFLNHLADTGLRDAIFLPVTEFSPIPAVLAFATREANIYTPEHLELLTNIGNLITHSFGRTVKMQEHARLAAIGGFASGIAHEIRSPLSTIIMALDYFRTEDIPGSASKRAALAFGEATRLERLLEDMLLYAKPIKLNLQKIILQDLVSEILETHKVLIEKKSQQFELHLPATQLIIHADIDRLRQVLLNVIRNACDAADEKSTIKIVLREDELSPGAYIEISNNGDCIPENLLPKIFEPFITTKAGGTGLGLGIVKRITEAHGGQITINSEQGGVTRVVIELPV